MRICLMTYRGNMYCGGQGIYTYYLAKALSELGHEVHIMTGPPYASAPEGVTVHQIPALDLYESNALTSLGTPLALLSPYNAYEYTATLLGMFPEIELFSIKAYMRLRELQKQGVRFDVIHDNQTLGWGFLLARGLAPVVATIHHPIYIDMRADLVQARRFRSKFRRMVFYSFLGMQHFVAKRMDRIIAVSDVSAADTIEVFKLPKSKVRVVPNGIDTHVFKRKDNLKRDPHCIIMVANTEDRKKGVIYLLKAMQQLRGEMDIRLNIVDRQGDNTKYAPKLIREYGLEDIVSITGRLTTEELVSYYSSSAVAVTASLYEGFGLPCAEAMSCGTPVIATSAGALPQIVGVDGAGILVPPGDPDALAVAIKQVVSDETLREKMGMAARKRIEESFSWKSAAKKTLDVYKEVI